MKYDVIIIGGGPGGYHAADLLGNKGLSCLLIEKRAIGGVCLNEGCIPTKSFLHSAQAGSHFESSSENHQKDVLNRKNKTVKTLVNGIESSLKRKKIKIVKGNAVISGRDRDGFSIYCDSDEYRAERLIVASGSCPVLPPIKGLEKGLEDGSVLTSREILNLDVIPERLVVVGGGVIGLEMAAYFNASGSAVSVIEMEDKIAGTLDDELADLLKKELEQAGIDFFLKSRVCSIGDGTLEFEKEGSTTTINFSKVLLSAGRKPQPVDGLDKLGVKMGKGFIDIDDSCRTEVTGLYAIGDVTSKVMLAHIAYRQAEAAVNDILGVSDPVDYSAVPSVIYTHPEVAWAGLSEKEACEQGFEVDVRKVSVNMSGRHVVESGLTSGICKIIIDKKKQTIIGGGLLGNYASEIIYSLVLMIQNKIPVSAIRKTIIPHPTVCEVIKEALF